MAGVQDRAVTLFLKGGHTIKLGGVSDVDRLIADLSGSFRDGAAVEIQTQDADRLLLWPGTLVGLIENRPRIDPTNSNAVDSSRSDIPYLFIENFLAPEDHQTIVARTLEAEGRFEASRVTTGREDYRESVMLSEDDVIGPFFRRRIQAMCADLARKFQLELMPRLDDSDIECQITAHRDGGFFHAHNDSGSPTTASRLLTYVYYFRARQNGFFGGELKLYESRYENGIELIGSRFHLIAPNDNLIIFFPSRLWHEVLPTYVPSGAFCDSRFTVNGWIRSGPLK